MLMKIERMSAAECERELAEIEARKSEVADEIAAIRPPGEAPPALATGAYPDYDPLASAGPEYRRVALEGAPAELVELERKHEELEAEERQLYLRDDHLKRRLAAARDEEARAAAPGELKRLAGEFDEMVSRAERAIAEAKEAVGACSSWVRAVERQQDLTGERGDVLTVEQFHRLGIVMRHRVVEVAVHEVPEPGGMYGRFAKKPALFNSRSDALRAAKRLLPTPNPGLIAKMKGRVKSLTGLGMDGGQSLTAGEYQVRQDLDEWHRERVDLIAAGHLEEAGSLEPGSKKRLQAAG